MKELPILFKGEMVRAILEGRKTQTRRVANLPHGFLPTGESGRIKSKHPRMEKPGAFIQRESLNGRKEVDILPSDYGWTGDRLWVKETFAVHPEFPAERIYRADRGGDYQGAAQGDFKWKPSIFMKREYSRITLEIVSVRVQRLQDISEDDAKAEGVEPFAPDDGRYRAGYKDLWESINGKGSWAKNPWVWVLEFKRV